MTRSLLLALLVLAGCGSRARTEPAVATAPEPAPSAGTEPVATTPPEPTGPSFPTEGIVETLADGTRELRVPGLRLRFRDGLPWARAFYALDATCGAGNPVLRSLVFSATRPDGSLVPGSAGMGMPEIEPVGGTVCSAWIPEPVLRNLLAATPIPEPFQIGRSRFSAANLAALLGPHAGPYPNVSALGNGYYAREQGSTDGVDWSIEVRANDDPTDAVRIWLTGPTDRLGDAERITLRAGRASCEAAMASGEGSGGTTSLLFLASRTDAEALTSADRLDVAGVGARLRLEPSPLAAALTARNALAATIAARPADFALDDDARNVPAP
jgi:hypothetical protein